MPAGSDIRALIVDDQQTIRSLVRAGLKDIGIHNIEDAIDGEDTLRVLLSARFNLIISAVRMTPQLKSIGFIMLTGRADTELVQRAQQFGVNNYLVKPFTVMTLRAKIEEVYGAIT